MEIIAKSTDWLFTDADRLATFLETDTGKRFLAQLAEAAPPLLSGGDINAILIRSGEMRGVSALIQNIVFLAHPPAPKSDSVDTYPSLENDAAWADGQKLNVEEPPKE